MTLTKEQLLSIGGLELAERLKGLDDRLLQRYCGTLSDFVEEYPGIEADLRKALFIGDNLSMTYALTELSEALANIYADSLVLECERIRNGVESADPETLEAELTAFLSTAATLSVDIQMEQHKNAVPPEPPEPISSQDDEPRGAPGSKRKSVLAVDDIPITLNLLRTALTEAGFNFNGVTSGASALDFIGKFTPDLFILDIEMPKMNGFELADNIRKAGHKAPVIFLTGNTTRDYLMRAVKTGAIDFIVKPVNGDTVAAKVKKILEA